MSYQIMCFRMAYTFIAARRLPGDSPPSKHHPASPGSFSRHTSPVIQAIRTNKFGRALRLPKTHPAIGECGSAFLIRSKPRRISTSSSALLHRCSLPPHLVLTKQAISMGRTLYCNSRRSMRHMEQSILTCVTACPSSPSMIRSVLYASSDLDRRR